MKKIITLLCAICAWGATQAQTPSLHFSKEGQLKIAQFTDMHVDLETPERRAEAEKTIGQLCMILDTEHPDFVVFTGDIVTGPPAAEAWHRVLNPVAERKLPFCVVLGNHDAEQDLTRAEIAKIVTSYPLSMNTLCNGELDDCALTVQTNGNNKPAALLYCLDSHDYSTVKGVDGYGWFTQAQIARYRTWSEQYTTSNGGTPLPAMAFFHIALPEYVTAWRNPENSHIGRAGEDECPGTLNPGMFAAMVECGDVMGVFVGHDHDIDYVVAEQGIALGYGRYSGDHTTYHHLLPGVRLIVLTEGKRGFETWIRERDSRMVDHVELREGRSQLS
ncbi:MAG: metallophosphoesterase family protein [Alistipes sp.]